MEHLQNAEEQSTKTTCSPIEELNIIAKEMVDPKNRDFYIFPFIKGRLRQFHLESFCDESDVFNQVYMRAKNKLLKGEHIEKFPGWFKDTAYKVVREISRKNKGQEKAIQRLDKSYVVDEIGPQLPDYATRQNCHKLREAMKLISEDDLELIILHWIEEMSWREIGDLLVTKGKEFSNNNKVEHKLRQRGKRALDRLRAQWNFKNN